MHQPRVVAALGDDLSDAILLAEALRLLDVLDLDAFFGSDAFGLCAYRLAKRLRELCRVVEQPDAAAIECDRHRLRMADTRQRSLDYHAVEAGQHSLDAVTVAFDQVRHPPTIPPAVLLSLLSWFRLCRGRVSGTKRPSYLGECVRESILRTSRHGSPNRSIE